MSEHFSDRLLDAIDRCGAPVCVGIDPVLESLPSAVLERVPAEAREEGANAAAVDAIYDFSLTVLKTVAPLVPVVKIQSAFFEKYQWEGVRAYYALVKHAREMGLLVIGDIKRGDMSTTAIAYAAGHIGDESDAYPDAVTLNPLLGVDSMGPFIDAARKFNKGLFILVRTSNLGSGQFQDVKLADGRSWSQMVADTLARVAAAGQFIGRRGFSAIGAVVGATQEQTIPDLRKRLPHSIFLLPGYGAQGAAAAQTRAAFINGSGAIVSASRSILYAHAEAKYAERFGSDWAKCVEQAVLDMKEDLKGTLRVGKAEG